MPKTETKENIYTYIQENAPVTAKVIRETFEISAAMTHRHLKSLHEKGRIQKRGTSPKVFYFPKETYITQKYTKNTLIEQTFCTTKPEGDILFGMEAFLEWCHQRNIDPQKEEAIYKKTYIKYYGTDTKNTELIDATEKIQKSFPMHVLTKMFYHDFYAIEKYGKTKIGTLTLHTKQSGDKALIKIIAEEIKTDITNLIQRYTIDAIGLIPHSIKRKVSFVPSVIQQTGILKTGIAQIDLQKIFVSTPIAQKSLKHIRDRIQNAQETIHVFKDKTYNRILLIDDACGSGSSMNETAKKIIQKGIAKEVYGYTFVGSWKGFEVIQET